MNKSTLLFGLVNAIIAFLITLLGNSSILKDDYYKINLILPISAFLVSAFIWQLSFKKNKPIRITSLIPVALVTGILSIYFAFFLSVVSQNLCYTLFENCISSNGKPPEGIFKMTPMSLFFASYIVLWYSWISVLGAFIMGLLLKKLH